MIVDYDDKYKRVNRKVFLIFILLPLLLAAEPTNYRLYWNFQVNELFTVDKYTEQSIIKDGQLLREREIRDYIALLPVKKIGSKFYLEGKYYSYQKPLKSDVAYQLNEVYDLKFYMDSQGHYEVAQEFIMPTIRDIPLFPDNPIKIGEFWQAKGIEIMEFVPPVTIPVDVNYQFIGIDKDRFGIPTAKIVFNYIINHMAEHNYIDIPYKFYGHSFSTLWYDLGKNLPLYIENIYDITFIYRDTTTIEYKGKLKGYYNIKKPVINKETAKEEIIEQMKKKEPDVDIKKSDEGVIVEFGDIYFKYKSAQLTDEAKNRLDKIGEVLNQYKDYNVIIKGHTDNIGSKQYNQKLSEERAREVLEYLIEKGYIDRKQGSYKGLGEKNPIGDNSTEAGRSKNRRVEIIIIPE